MLICYTIKPVVYGGLAVRLARVRHLRFVPMITGLGFAFHGGSRKRDALKGLASFLYRKAMVPVHTAIFQNPDDRAMFIESGIVPAHKTKIVNGSGVNLKQFARVPLPPGPDVTFLLAARLLKAKGIREYVEAAGIVKKKVSQCTFLSSSVTRIHPRMPFRRR